MALAFELPEHLPRSSKVQDRSTYILTQVSEASDQSLSADLAASWLAELDAAIQNTKSRISRRIQDDLPAFERQLKASTSLQVRLDSLSSNINQLAESLNDTNIGIIPVLVRTLATNKSLSDQANDSIVTHHVLAYLLRLREELRALSGWVERGKLPEAEAASRRLQTLLAEAPDPLDRAEVMPEIKKRHRALTDRVQEQLDDAYAKSITVSCAAESTSLSILAYISVPPASVEITLPGILKSLAPEVLSTRLSVLRRDIISRLVEPVLLSTRSLEISTSETLSTLTLTSSSPWIPLQSLRTLSTFLHSNLFAHLPPTHTAFSSTFHAQILAAILTHYLKPSIPSSPSLLSPFLATVDKAVRFEEETLPMDTRDRPIMSWVEDIASHYERKRREDVLRHARQVITRQEGDNPVRVEVARRQYQELPVQSQEEQGNILNSFSFHHETSHGNKVGPSSKEVRDKSSDEEDPSEGWGWGDDTDGDADIEVLSSPPLMQRSKEVSPSDAVDDPWGDDTWDTAPIIPSPPEPKPTQSMSQGAPKLAKRLEKFSAKAKGDGISTTPVPSPSIAAAAKPSPPLPQLQAPSRSQLASSKAKRVEKETYLVSSRVQKTLEIAEALLQEGLELMGSKIFSKHLTSESATPGQLLVAAAPRVLDLHRALYPITHSLVLAHDPEMAMRWANDCKYLGDQMAQLCNKSDLPSANKWIETGERFQVLGETWFEDVVARQQRVVKNILARAQGFIEVADVKRFEEYRTLMEQVLNEIKSIAEQWRVTLTTRAYFYAIGQVVDDALFRVLDDILSLEDIPEANSERLSELCEILVPLEDLFTETSGEQSVVGRHVPLWFKFSYLSWLIKGSIADLSYLFDQGMLVDYEIDELVRLLRALFAETPLRETTIAKISKGHPASVPSDYI